MKPIIALIISIFESIILIGINYIYLNAKMKDFSLPEKLEKSNNLFEDIISIIIGIYYFIFWIVSLIF